MRFVRRASTIITAFIVCCAPVAAAAAAQPVRAADAAAVTSQQPAPPKAAPRAGRAVKGGVSPQVLAAVALGLGGLAVAAAASGGRSNASPN